MTSSRLSTLSAALLLAAITALPACSGAPDKNAAQATGTSAATDAAGPAALPVVPLRLIRADGRYRPFRVEVARTKAEQERGLMHRRQLARDAGMVFPFPVPMTASFWMKDTPLPLDLLFVRPDGTVAARLRGKPGDLTPISAGEPVSAVVEIPAGAAWDMQAGTRVNWGRCAPPGGDPALDADMLSFCPAP